MKEIKFNLGDPSQYSKFQIKMYELANKHATIYLIEEDLENFTVKVVKDNEEEVCPATQKNLRIEKQMLDSCDEPTDYHY